VLIQKTKLLIVKVFVSKLFMFKWCSRGGCTVFIYYNVGCIFMVLVNSNVPMVKVGAILFKNLV